MRNGLMSAPPCSRAVVPWVWGPSPLIALRQRLDALELGRSVTRALLLDAAEGEELDDLAALSDLTRR